jgi:hypothetical protein
LRAYQAWLDAHPEAAGSPMDLNTDQAINQAQKEKKHTKLQIRSDPDTKPYSPFD